MNLMLFRKWQNKIFLNYIKTKIPSHYKIRRDFFMYIYFKSLKIKLPEPDLPLLETEPQIKLAYQNCQLIL